MYEATATSTQMAKICADRDIGPGRRHAKGELVHAITPNGNAIITYLEILNQGGESTLGWVVVGITSRERGSHGDTTIGGWISHSSASAHAPDFLIESHPHHLYTPLICHRAGKTFPLNFNPRSTS